MPFSAFHSACCAGLHGTLRRPAQHAVSFRTACCVEFSGFLYRKKEIGTNPHGAWCLFLCGEGGLSLLRGNNTLLGDACFLAGELAQVVQLGATYLTNLVHLNAVDVGACDGEDTLYTNSA